MIKDDPAVQVVRMERSPTVVVRARTTWAELPTAIQQGLERVNHYLESGERQRAGRTVIAYLDHAPTIEVGVEVDRPLEGTREGGVRGSELPAGRYARTVHVGPRRQVTATHAALRRWLVTNGHELNGPAFERFGEAPADAANGSDRTTEVAYRIG